MSPNPPTVPAAPSGDDAPALAWGVDPGPAGRSRPPSLAELRRSRVLAPAVAGVGALALFGSLISEWQVATIRANLFGPSDAEGSRQVLSNVGDLGAWGTGYLMGVFLLVAGTALLLFGPRGLAEVTRVLSLSIAGVSLAVLAGLTLHLGERNVALGSLAHAVDGDRDPVRLELGRGVTCAFIGVAALALAAYLTRRPRTHPTATVTATPAGTLSGNPGTPGMPASHPNPDRAPAGHPADGQPPLTQPPLTQPPLTQPPLGMPPSGQPPMGMPTTGTPPASQLDLTVEPTAPFTRPLLDRAAERPPD